MPQTRASARLATASTATVCNSLPTPEPTVAFDEDEEGYDNDADYQYTEEDVAEDAEFDIEMKFKTGTKATQLNLAITSINAVTILAELADLPVNFPRNLPNLPKNHGIRSYRNISDFFFARPIIDEATEIAARIDPDLLQTRLDRFRYLANSFVIDLKAFVASYKFLDCPLPYHTKLYIHNSNIEILVDSICSGFLEHAQYLLANPKLELAHLFVLPRVFDVDRVEQMLGRGVYVDILTHISGRRKIYVGSGTGKLSVLSRVLEYTFRAATIFHDRLIWMTGWQPSFHLLTKPIKSSRHRIYDILNETFGCALTGSYRLKKPLRQINLHSNPALVEFVKNWRAKHDLPDLDPDNEVGVNYCFPLAQGITPDADYAKDLKCENCRVALGEGVRSYASIKGLLYDSLSRLCDNCYVWKRRNPNGQGRSMLLEVRRKSDIRTFLMGLTSCTACGKPALPKGPDGSRRFHQHQDIVEICAKLCKLCLDLWKQKGAMHPIAQLHAPKDFAYACEICKTTKSRLFDFWLGKGNNRTSDFGKLVCHTCIPALMKRHGFSSGEISLFNSVTKALPKNVSASFPSERFSLSSGKLVYITNTYGSAWLEAAWAWLKKHAGIDLSTRDGVLIQRQKDALAEGLEITDEMIAVAQKKYAPGAPAKNGLKRKFVHLEEED